jgi:hypothetical protein
MKGSPVRVRASALKNPLETAHCLVYKSSNRRVYKTAETVARGSSPSLCACQAIRYGDVLVDGERWPGFLHVIQHPQGRVLVDTGLIDSTPAPDEEWSPRFDPDAIPRDVVCAITTHLHFDHCGGIASSRGYRSTCSGSSARRPALRTTRFPTGSSSRAPRTWSSRASRRFCLDSASSRRRARHQSVLVETDDGLVVVAGDVAYTWGDGNANPLGAG